MHTLQKPERNTSLSWPSKMSFNLFELYSMPPNKNSCKHQLIIAFTCFENTCCSKPMKMQKILHQFASLHSISKLCCNRMSLMNAQNIFVSHGPRRSCTSGPALGKCTGMRDSQRPGTKNKLLDFRSLSLSPLKQVYLAIINHLQK